MRHSDSLYWRGSSKTSILNIMRLKTRFDAKAGAADLWDYIREPRPYRWTFLTISILIPLAGIAMLAQESHFRPPDAPKVSFISTFAEGRSDEVGNGQVEVSRWRDDERVLARGLSEQPHRRLPLEEPVCGSG